MSRRARIVRGNRPTNLDLHTLAADIQDDDLVLVIGDSTSRVTLGIAADDTDPQTAILGALRLASAASQYAAQLADHVERLANPMKPCPRPVDMP